MFRDKSEGAVVAHTRGSDEKVRPAAGDEETPCLGRGTLKIGVSLPEFVHMQGLNTASVSVGHICDQKRIVVFTPRDAVEEFSEANSNVLTDDPDTKLCDLQQFGYQEEAFAVVVAAPSELRNRRLVHANGRNLNLMQKHATKIPRLTSELKVCHQCELGKAKKNEIDSHFKKVSVSGEIVHSNLAGEIPVITLETFEAYKKSNIVRKYYPEGVQRLHRDGGGETECANILEHTQTTHYSPQHNIFAERVNRTILDHVRTLLEEAGLSAKYWEYALNHAAFVKNRIWHSGIGTSPYDKIMGEKPSQKHVRVFECSAFIHVQHPKKNYTLALHRG